MNLVSASTWSNGNFDITYYDCSTDNYYGGFYFNSISYNDRIMLNLGYTHQIYVKFDGTWTILDMDQDQAGHGTCTSSDYTNGGYWYHGNKFHWNLADGTATHKAGVEYWVYIIIYNTGLVPEVRIYQRFNYTGTGGNVIPEFETWWKLLPDVNGDTTNEATQYKQTNPPHAINTEASELKSTWVQQRFNDSTDSTKYIYTNGYGYTGGITSKWAGILWAPENDYKMGDAVDGDNIQYDRPVGVDYMTYTSATSGSVYESYTVWHASW
jgi:hypothetical protein